MTVVPCILLFSLYGPSLVGYVPSWFSLILAITFFLYMVKNNIDVTFGQLLDNVDGKQARKTGNSSPLGLLFDHGCDAMVTVFTGITMARVVQLGNSPYLLVPMSVGSYPFFYATLEEYYVGSLNLPCVNGPNEGCFLIVLIYLASAILGNDIWIQ